MEQLKCFLFGHKWQKAVYVDTDFEVWVCTRCGRIHKIGSRF